MITLWLWTLITIQIILGAFDTIYHHELTERLAWCPSQRHELQLHGVRNLVYCALFVGLGTLHMNGALAWVLGAILLVELGITLKDFVEEDMTRKLPASERVTHTLLALNYGAILALLAPILLVWAQAPTGITLVNYGLWTWLMLLAGLGVGIFGLRDLAAAKCLSQMAAAPTLPALLPAGKRLSILITGGTGFIGSRLIAALLERGHDITVLTRRAENAANLGTPIRIITDLDQISDDTYFDTMINLAGQSVAGWLWTAAYKEKILTSRLDMTRGLVSLMKRLKHKPESFISGSAIGVYGIEADTPQTEDTPLSQEGVFSQTLCQSWEAEANKAKTLGIRTVNLRIGLVLDTAGGSLGQMLFPFEFGLGGPFGNGRQWMSWILRDDLVRLLLHCVTDAKIGGPVNGTAPQPVTNRAFAAALGRALNRPAFIPIPAGLLTFALGDLARQVFLGSQNILPKVAEDSGFVFAAPGLDTAFATLFNTPAKAPDKPPAAETPPSRSAKKC